MTSSAHPDLPQNHATRLRSSQLRLYVTRGTPNSTRAEHNLRTALNELDGGNATLQLEVIDVSANLKLALSDGVIVTPTLVGLGLTDQRTIVGDLSNTANLNMFLASMRQP